MTNIRYFKVTLTLNFEYHHSDSEDLDYEEDAFYHETKEEFQKRKDDLKATDEMYGTQEKIQAFIKGFNPLEVIECIPEDELISAEWHKKDFKISFIIKIDNPKKTPQEVKKWLRETSLEDGEYESCGTTAWTVKTLGETMEYGLTDYRNNLILVEEVDPKTIFAAAKN